MTVSINGIATPKFNWIDSPPQAFSLFNVAASVSWTDDDLTGETSPNAKFVILQLKIRADTVGSSGSASIGVRKNGTVPTRYPQLVLDRLGTETAIYHYETIILGLDTNKVFEYEVSLGTGWQVDVIVDVLGYIE